MLKGSFMRDAIFILFMLCFVPQVQAYCFTLGTAGYGICSSDPESIKYPLNWVVVLWLAAVITFGKLLYNPRVHILIKVVLFFLSFPASPVLTPILMLSHVIERRLGWHNQATARSNAATTTPVIPVVAVKLGDFELDTVAQCLHKNGNTIALEPKVYQLLVYLYEHQGRVISLEELHQNIWSGQIVTDTAVRRTVSKLRNALDDTDTQNPVYIHSVMKRGYRFTPPSTLRL